MRYMESARVTDRLNVAYGNTLPVRTVSAGVDAIAADLPNERMTYMFL